MSACIVTHPCTYYLRTTPVFNSANKDNLNLNGTDNFTESKSIGLISIPQIQSLCHIVVTVYLDAWLRQPCGLGQVLSEADARVRVGLKGGTQEFHVFLREAGPFPAASAARAATAGAHVWGKRSQIKYNAVNNFFLILSSTKPGDIPVTFLFLQSLADIRILILRSLSGRWGCFSFNTQYTWYTKHCLELTVEFILLQNISPLWNTRRTSNSK